MTEIKCQMAGIVAEVLVKPGHAISEGQAVVNIESMKMLVQIKAEAAGKVAEVKVEVGDFVQEGDTVALIGE